MKDETRVKIEECTVAIICLLAMVLATIFLGPTGCAKSASVSVPTAASAPPHPETLPARGASRILPAVSYVTRFKAVFGDRSYESCDPVAHIRKFLMEMGYLTPLPHGIVVTLYSSKHACTDHWEVDASVELLYPAELLDQKLRESLTAKFAPYRGL